MYLQRQQINETQAAGQEAKKRVVNGARLSKQGPKKKLYGVKKSEPKDAVKADRRKAKETYQRSSPPRRAHVNRAAEDEDFAVNLTSNAHENDDYCAGAE